MASDEDSEEEVVMGESPLKEEMRVEEVRLPQNASLHKPGQSEEAKVEIE